jgi:hypothetical protein
MSQTKASHCDSRGPSRAEVERRAKVDGICVMKVNTANFFKSVAKEPDQFYIIHYSSLSLYDADSEGHSPRITSIAVMHFATRQTTSFSVHSVADILKIGKDDVDTRYNDIGKEMLLRFFEFVRGRLDKYSIHWRMQNLTYGFEHLEHRSRSLAQGNWLGRLRPEGPPAHFGINLPSASERATPALIRRFAIQAEALGFADIWVSGSSPAPCSRGSCRSTSPPSPSPGSRQ